MSERNTFGALLLVLSAAACSGGNGSGDVADTGDGADADADVPDGADVVPPVLEWDETDLSYRVRVTLRAHPDRDRTDVPVIAALSHPVAFVRRNVSVFEITGGSPAEPVAAGAWMQPDGRNLEVGFIAAGTTSAGATRDFWIYYEASDTPEVWLWPAEAWRTFAPLDRDTDGRTDGYHLTGGCCAIQRAIDQDSGELVDWRRTDDNTFLRLSSTGWTAAEGFTDGYQLENRTETFAPVSAADVPPEPVLADGDGFSGAVAAPWSSRNVPVPHSLFLTYRVFQRFPFVEAVLSARPETDPASFEFSSADWNGREIFLADSYDRMVSDTRGDEALDPVWDTAMRWLVAYDAASERGFGWFLQGQGVVRAGVDADGVYLHDSYGYSAGGTTAFRYLWMPSADKDEIVDLFDAMAPGVDVGAAERRDLNVLRPSADEFFFPGDTLETVVSTPGSSEPVTVSFVLADGTEQPIAVAREGTTPLWRSVEPLPLTATHPPGRWTLTARSGPATESVGFEFRLPQHPKLLFGAEDLPALRARKDEPAFADIWAAMLDNAAGYDAPIPDPGPGRDIRGYADRLINLALIQLVDSAQPYADLLWTYFFTMLRYPNWDESATPFNNLDLTVGHFLTALALTYDWHYDTLTPAERAEVRARLRTVAARWVSSYYLRVYRDISWQNFGTVTNNHYWINNEGVAAAAFVLAEEMPEDERAPWVARLEENLGVILSVLEDDGSSNEGVAYHSYGQINLFPWIDMRDRALGGDTAAGVPWFRESVLWDLYSVLPGGADNYGGVANFGDCPPYHYNAPRTIQAWLAARLGDPVAQWTALHLDRASRTAMSYLWFDPAVAEQAPETLPTSRLFPQKGIYAWRSSWADDAAYFSIKSGSFFGGHEQPDAGHFILHRAGIPYVTDHGYSYLKVTDEHNVILVDGQGEEGSGEQWMPGVDPVHWARIASELSDPRFFDVVADPAPMLLSDAATGWTREIVGIAPAIFVVHDELTASRSVTFDWLLHGYRSDPPAPGAETYSYTERRTENPFVEVDGRHWSLQPQDAAPPLHVADVSAASWAAVVEPSLYVPELNPDTRGYNEAQDQFQVGYRLRRTLSGDRAVSTVVLWFDDAISVESWSDASAEAVRLYSATGGDTAVVVWPAAGSVAGFHGYHVQGAMAGRRFDEPAYFVRAATFFASGTTTLLAADPVVDAFVRFEHAGTAADPLAAVVRASAAGDVSFHCPAAPAEVLVDGASTTVRRSASLLTVALTAGLHRIELR
jgi:hypothetical protein